jgi:hypothetical protein
MIWHILRLIGVTSELLEPEEAVGQILEKEVTITWRPAIVEKVNERISYPLPHAGRSVHPVSERPAEQETRRKHRADLLGWSGQLPPQGADAPSDLGGEVRIHARKRSR